MRGTKGEGEKMGGGRGRRREEGGRDRGKRERKKEGREKEKEEGNWERKVEEGRGGRRGKTKKEEGRKEKKWGGGWRRTGEGRALAGTGCGLDGWTDGVGGTGLSVLGFAFSLSAGSSVGPGETRKGPGAPRL